jgi:hypothetical protein
MIPGLLRFGRFYPLHCRSLEQKTNLCVYRVRH